ncbi:hypothetical protein [Sinorhizobium psoraleae]|uniref:hypothetical protein n=1 Tax=Sinorhizobium psoraleae TaxID=520838 RepID=UPI00289DFC34|nr:hypothetical protein [Sinorhizobium psoraleae]
MRRIAPEDWYAVKRLEDDVTSISAPFIQEFFRCNVWHVRGRDRDMLVDSGRRALSMAGVFRVFPANAIGCRSRRQFDGKEK